MFLTYDLLLFDGARLYFYIQNFDLHKKVPHYALRQKDTSFKENLTYRSFLKNL
jgi:hypothetical protein